MARSAIWRLKTARSKLRRQKDKVILDTVRRLKSRALLIFKECLSMVNRVVVAPRRLWSATRCETTSQSTRLDKARGFIRRIRVRCQIAIRRLANTTRRTFGATILNYPYPTANGNIRSLCLQTETTCDVEAFLSKDFEFRVEARRLRGRDGRATESSLYLRRINNTLLTA